LIVLYIPIEVKLMTKKKLLHKTVETLSKLPEDKVREVDDFASFILKKYEEDILRKGVQKLSESSGSFDF